MGLCGDRKGAGKAAKAKPNTPVASTTVPCPEPPRTYGKAIKIEGDAAFRRKTIKALDDIKKTPTGKKLLASLDRSGKTVTIRQASGSQGNSATPADQAKGQPDNKLKPGEGTDTTVRFNPDKAVIGDGSKPWMTRPPAVGLAHELVHADHNARGTNLFDDTGEEMAVGLYPYDTNDFTENKIRAEWKPKQPKRTEY